MRALVLASMFAAAGGWACAAVSAESQWSWGVQQSRWREWSSNGVPLLEERGTLTALAWDGSLRHHSVDMGWRLEWAGGTRGYTGRNSLGAPVNTDVSLQEGRLAVNLGWPAGAAWQLRAGLQPTWVQRDLHGTANALGYTEQWRWTQGSTGVRWQQPLGAGTWRVDAMAFTALDAQLRVQLPGNDAAILRPKKGRGWQLSAVYAVPWGDHWRWQLGIDRHALRFDQSDAVPLMRGPVLQGALQQPRTHLDGWGLQLGLRRQWR